MCRLKLTRNRKSLDPVINAIKRTVQQEFARERFAVGGLRFHLVLVLLLDWVGGRSRFAVLCLSDARARILSAPLPRAAYTFASH